MYLSGVGVQVSSPFLHACAADRGITMALKPKQQLFLNEYLVDMNATQAAIRAGYSEHSAYSCGQRMLKNVEIQAAIQQKLNDSAMKSDEILQKLTEIARADMGDFLDVSSMAFQLDLNKAKEQDKLKLIKKIKQFTVIKNGKDNDGEETTRIEFELLDQLRALELLGKYRKLFIDRTDITSGGEPLVNQEIFEKALKKIYGDR